MADRELFRRTVAEFFEVEPESVGPEFALSGPRMQGSIARYALAAAIRRRTGAPVAAVHTAVTYGQLEAAAFATNGTTPGHAADAPPPSLPVAELLALHPMPAGPERGLTCGIDVELVENLPPVDDYWASDFYSTLFTPAEIAYCLLQEQPRMHFAARWCAKEALKKAEPSLLQEEMAAIEVARNGSDLHFLRCRSGTKTRLPFAVSISHTPLFAAAVVARAESAAPAPTLSDPPNPAPADGALPALQRRLARAHRLALFSALLGLLGVALGVAAVLHHW